MKSFRVEMQRLSSNSAARLIKQGTQQCDSGKFGDALASFDKALQAQPNSYIAWFYQGIILCDHLAKYEEAFTSFNKAIEINPYCDDSWNNRGIALRELSQHEEALASYDKAIEINPNHHEAWNNRGVVLNELSQYEAAIANYDKVIEIKSDYYQVWVNRSENVFLSSAHNPLPALVVGATLSQQNPQLNQRGYHGQVITLETGLTQVAPHSEGWSDLQCALGKAHFNQGKREQQQGRKSNLYWQKAQFCLDRALSALSDESFPQLRLETLQIMIRVLLAQGENVAAQVRRKAGVELLQTLLNQAPTTAQKQRIEAEFSGFSQIEVDVWLQAGEPITALETAERFKNRCLTSILEAWQEKVISPSYATMRTLCTPDTAIVYWQLSTDSLATFILSNGSNTPEVFPSDGTAQAQQLNLWLQEWNKDYREYASKKLTQTEKENHPWRQNLKCRLTRLKEILQIEAICQHLPDTVQNLILVPHRDLHLFPLHTFFPNHLSCTYLPSVQIGLTLQKQPSQLQTYAPLLSISDPKTDQDPMPFAQLESAIVRHLVKPSTPIGGEQATTANILHNLKQPFATFHFTGHSAHNTRIPEASNLDLCDGPLTAEIIAQQNLSSYRLIILSACETALTGNDGIRTEYVGLASAFLKAGANNVLSTLWPVDEISSCWLTIRFYEFLDTGDSPAKALRQAQHWFQTVTWQQLADWITQLSQILDLDQGYIDILNPRSKNTLKEGTIMGLDQPTKYSHPYYWAAFTLTGRG